MNQKNIILSIIVRGKRIKIRNICDIINFLDFLLSAIGIFGTILGLSNSLLTAFSEGSDGVKGIQQFVVSLTTVFDTTVLALACAKLVDGFAWVVGRIRYGFIEQYTSLIRKVLSMENHAVKLKNNNKPVIDNSHPINPRSNNTQFGKVLITSDYFPNGEKRPEPMVGVQYQYDKAGRLCKIVSPGEKETTILIAKDEGAVNSWFKRFKKNNVENSYIMV